VHVLVEVERGAHAEDVLATHAPGGIDRGLAWNLTLGVLRRRGTIDAMLAPHLRRGLRGLDPPVRAALRMGAYELAFCRTARHAAVHQAVEACRRAGARRATGLVNAVLRRVAKSPVPDDPLLDVPPWLAARWGGHADWLLRLREPAPICGVWRDEPVPELPTRPAPLGLPSTFALDAAGDIRQLPGFAEGRWWVMDPAAVKVADLCAEEIPPGGRVLDACAAPGGKALRLACHGAQVVAVDLSEERLARITENTARTGLPLRQLAHDWLTGPNDELGTFDAVLVDAPCTGLGTIRRHPEIKWRRMPSDPAAMAIRQRAITAAAATHVAPEGALVYAVCSVAPEEGAAVVADLPGFEVTGKWASAPPAGDEDGFQAFVLRRTALNSGGP